MDPVVITWNSCKKTGTSIRKLNGGNLAPNIYNEMYGCNIRKPFSELNLAFARLHDAPLTNNGCRLVDISHIFPLFHLDANDPRNYEFSYTDDYIRNCIEDANTPIFYRLGESIDHSVKKYKIYPPSDVDKWIDICSNIIRHYTEGLWNGFHFKIEYWEIWNEPEANTRATPDTKNLMWLGTIDEFNTFFVKVATELKKRFPHLKFGGPAHCGFDSWPNITEIFIKFCAEHHAPLDFYSYHCYSSDPYGWIQETPWKVRKLLDQYGYHDAEIHLNEWHYHEGGWPRMRTDHAYKKYQTEQVMCGLDSAAYLTTVMSLWQDTPLSYGAYYTTCANSSYGCFSMLGAKTVSWFGMKAFGDIVRYPIRLEAFSPKKEITVLAGENEDGEKAMLISAFKTGNVDYEVKMDIPVSSENCEVRMLDKEHLLNILDDVQIDGSSIRFRSESHSACVLIRIKKH